MDVRLCPLLSDGLPGTVYRSESENKKTSTCCPDIKLWKGSGQQDLVLCSSLSHNTISSSLFYATANRLLNTIGYGWLIVALMIAQDSSLSGMFSSSEKCHSCVVFLFSCFACDKSWYRRYVIMITTLWQEFNREMKIYSQRVGFPSTWF